MNDHRTPEEEIAYLHELYADQIYRYAHLTLGNGTDAMDVVQEVFLRAFRSWNTYRHEANTRTWLLSITRNYITDVIRKKQSEKRLLDSYKASQLHENTNDEQSILEIEELLAQLKPTYRQVVILRYVDDLSMYETAKVLGWSEGKVRVTSHRALKKLRSLMGPNFREEDHRGELRSGHYS